MRYLLLSAIVFVIALWAGCGGTRAISDDGRTFEGSDNIVRVMFYNVENLFDTINDPEVNDDDFTPEGSYRWSGYRYYRKQQDLAKVIMNTGGWVMPTIIGLCEVENLTVLEHLIFWTPLRQFGYDIVHFDSPDARGIDVALLYRKEVFTPIHQEPVPVLFPFSPDSRTRDILYTVGVIGSDTLHLFVNHWPSRRGGEQQSEPRRMAAAEVLRHRVDSLLAIDSMVRIILMGDFNDEPTNRSITGGLGATGDSTRVSQIGLYNFMYPLKVKKGQGTYKFRQDWNLIDMFIVSPGLLNRGEGLTAGWQSVRIVREDFLLEDDPTYPGKRVARTYLGPRYLGGYSDHLPILLDLEFRSREN